MFRLGKGHARRADSPLPAALSSAPVARGIETRIDHEKPGIKIAHINVNSLRNKIDQVRFLTCRQSIDIMCITETRLDDKITNYDICIDGFQLIRKDRIGRVGGGVCIYVKTEISYIVRTDITTTPLIACAWIELTGLHNTNTLVCCIYRPPDAAAIID